MISITETAAQKVLQQLAKRGHGLGIKIGVRTTGCSGMAYVLEYVDTEPKDEYFKYEDNGISIWVDKRSLAYIAGLEMDWKKNGLNEGFDFINPNEKARCGCGESFSI